MLSGFLPIGSVVLLEDSTKRVMIMGVLQQQTKEDGEVVVWDYSGCLYPEGYMGADKCFLFNTDQIAKIYAIGYQDEEQFAFKEKADEVWKQIHAQEESEV